MQDLEKLTRKELCAWLYEFYLKRGVPPIGRKTLLTLKEFTKRYLNGIGCCKGFRKPELISILKRELINS